MNAAQTKALTERYGTPLIVYDENLLLKQMQDYKTYFASTQFSTEVLYASKAFSCAAILKLVQAHGLGVDVVSGGELYVAQQVQFNPKMIYFHGNNKSEEELIQALHYGVKTFIVDNSHELATLAKLTSLHHKKAHVLLRINPLVEAHTHSYIMTASADSKFGISIESIDEIKSMIQVMDAHSFLTFDGFHSHIGSQILQLEAFKVAIDKLVSFTKSINNIRGKDIHTLNIGGGYGVNYLETDKAPTILQICEFLIKSVEEALQHHGVHIQKLIIEPGRSLVAEAGSTLYQVGFIKQTKNKEFLFVDGGMADNIRPALYQAKYHFSLIGKETEVHSKLYEIAGKCCESGDILGNSISLPQAQPGDILKMHTTGAYGYSMASNYNRLPRPAIVFVKDGSERLVMRRETYDDMNALDCILKEDTSC